MDIKETLEYIHSVKWQGSKPGLSRTESLLKSLGNPEKNLKFVHVAGTNGKGSTCALIASVLQKAGYVTGLYTSPYIMRFNERIQVDGEQISDDDLIRYTKMIKPHADAMDDAPTEFEIITALAMKYFEDFGCDVVVLEVGMGGELDSTNVIDTPDLAIITAIDYDHVEQLGPTLSDIARAKAGIIKNGGDVLIYGGDSEVEGVLRAVATEKRAVIHKAVFERITKADVSLVRTRLVIEPYEEMQLPLAGVYQPYNALVAITALELLREKGYRITTDHITEGIAAVRWQGRFEFLGYDPVFVIDGAHNVHAITAAAESLKAYFSGRKIIFIMGVLADKDAQSMAKIIAPLAERVYTVTPNSPRAMKPSKLAEIFEGLNVETQVCYSISDAVESALDTAEQHGSGAVICAIGSLYLTADIKVAYQMLCLTDEE